MSSPLTKLFDCIDSFNLMLLIKNDGDNNDNNNNITVINSDNNNGDMDEINGNDDSDVVDCFKNN